MDDHEQRSRKEAVEAALKLSDAEKLELAVALLERTNRYDIGLERLAERYPHAPKPLLSSSAYHLYDALASSFVGVLAHVELNLRSANPQISEALVSDPAYHLYNWLQLESLLPWSQRDFHDELLALKETLDDGDVTDAQALLKKILEQLEGASSPPMPDFP